ncbi:MAG: AAA family ATPase, partial [Bacteroidales bacterium]
MPKKNNKNKGGKSKNSKSIISDIDDDFDNFLSEFKIDEEIETSDSINSDAIDVKKVNIIDVKFSSDYKGKINPNFIFLSTSYLKSIHDGYLIIKTEIEEVIDIDISYNIELRDYDNNLISSDTSSLDSKENTTLLPINSPIEGEYWLSISSNKTSIFRKKLTFVDVKDNYAKYLNLDTFSLYRINCDDNGDIVAMLKRGGRSCYNYDNLAGILLTAQFTSISELTLPCAITVIIENQENEIIFQENKEEILNKTESIQFITEIENIVCRTGNYLLKILFYDTIIIKTIFVVGQRDVRSSFRPAQLTPRSETGGLSISKITPRQKLESMIGLKRVKKQLKGAIAKSQLKKARNKFNLPANKQQLHFAFMGSPGTGKTTVAKLLGAIYKEIGVLSRGHVVLRDRASLMTQNWGGEGELVNLALDEAKGGILFIDEAYDLITEHKSDPGKLVLSSLLSTMADDNNRDIMIILAGYTAPMERLLSKNPGVLSRVTRIYFEDYKEDELMQIADLWLGNNCYKLTSDARKYLQSVISNAYASRNDFFGNARYINNLLETEIQPAMANRIMNDDPESLTYAQLTTIEASDIPNYTKANADAEDAIKKLDNMVGLNSLKKDIRSHLSYIKFVQARRNNHIDTPIPPLHMVFTGNPGTGKSSVAEYLGDIYRSMGILSVGNVIKVTRADMIDSAIGGTEEKMKELINAAHGNILFIDEAYTLFDESGKDYGKNAIEV